MKNCSVIHSLTLCHSSECQRHEKKSTCGNSGMAKRQQRTIKGILYLSDLCREAWHSRTQYSQVNSKPFAQTLRAFFFLWPHCSSLTLLLQLRYDTLDVVDMETWCMWLRSKTVCNLPLDWDSAKAETSASLQRGPDSSGCHWQRLSARSFAENLLQARVRNRAIYPKL